MINTLDASYKIQQFLNFSLNPFYSFYWATLGNAKALGLEKEIGSFKKGCFADIVVMNTGNDLVSKTRMRTCKSLADGPQGMLLAERVIQEIAYFLNKDPLEIRKINLYGKGQRSITPYHQKVTDNISKKIIEELASSANYPHIFTILYQSLVLI